MPEVPWLSGGTQICPQSLKHKVITTYRGGIQIRNNFSFSVVKFYLTAFSQSSQGLFITTANSQDARPKGVFPGKQIPCLGKERTMERGPSLHTEVVIAPLAGSVAFRMDGWSSPPLCCILSLLYPVGCHLLEHSHLGSCLPHSYPSL